MATWKQLSAAFLLSLTLVGVSIYYFIEDNNFLGRVYIFAAIFAFLSLFIVFRSFFYLKHKATFNEVFFVLMVPLIPVLIVLAQKLFGIYDIFIVSTGVISTSSLNYIFFINAIDFVLLPYYIVSNFLIFRTFIRYPFIRLKGTSEKGIPPKFFGFLLMFIIPATYILTSVFYLENLFLVIFGGVYFYSALLMLFV
jgi:hypothetical protein